MLKLLKTAYIIFGFISLALGIIGIFLPIMPTTPFILLSAFCFSRGSEKIYNWFISNKYFGRIVKDWEENRVIKLKVKIFVSVTLPFSLIYPLFFKDLSLPLRTLIVIVAISVLTFIWTRPSAVASSNHSI